MSDQPWGALVVDNRTGGPIDVVLISKCNAMSYGLNRLSKPPIPNGQRLAFRVGTGCWDVTVGRGGGCCNGTCSGSQSSALKFHTPCVQHAGRSIAAED